MAKPARDTVAHFYPAVVTVKVNGTVVTNGQKLSLAPGARDLELTTEVVCRGAVSPASTGADPIETEWTLFALNGCKNAEFSSPSSATTRLRVLNPLDRAAIGVVVTTRFETIRMSFDLIAPPCPATLVVVGGDQRIEDGDSVVFPAGTETISLSTFLKSFGALFPVPEDAVCSWSAIPVAGFGTAMFLDSGDAETDLVMLADGDQANITFNYVTSFDSASLTFTLEIDV